MTIFGNFNGICGQIALPFCPLVGESPGIEPSCYSRNIEISSILIFEPATLVIYVIALIMTVIMVLNIKSKYTAVGRKEIMFFFYLYGITIVFEFLVVSGIISVASDTYAYFTAAHSAMVLATLWTLLFNGFVGFQWIEDGTSQSLWGLRISSAVIFSISYFISIGTFQNTFGFQRENPVAFWIIYFAFGGLCILLYVLLQITLVLNTLDERWALVDLAIGAFFFVLGQIIEYSFSPSICDMAKHYVDGMFFGTICSLLSVMMVYKYWDGLTKEDLEFSVGGKLNTWEIRDPLLNDNSMADFSKRFSNEGYGAANTHK